MTRALVIVSCLLLQRGPPLSVATRDEVAEKDTPDWLTGFVCDGTLLVSKILGDVWTPETLRMQGIPLIEVNERVRIKVNGTHSSVCTLLHRAGRPDGGGETVIQIWKCQGYPFMYVIGQGASGSSKYISQKDLGKPTWENVHHTWAEVYPGLRVKTYESYKGDKMWTKYKLQDTLGELMTSNPDDAFFFTGASRGAPLAEVLGLRFAMTFQGTPGYRIPYVVSTGAYRWTNTVGRDIARYALQDHFAHLLLSKSGKKYDFVSRWPPRTEGYADMYPSFSIDVGTGEMQECSGSCPGQDIDIYNPASFQRKKRRFAVFHEPMAFRNALRRAMQNC